VIEGDDPYPTLQEMGVLARVEHEELSGSSLNLSATQIAHLIQYHVLPPEVEQLLGLDLERNNRLVQSIQALPDDWPILVFATSVDHARVLAAMLCVRGISAKPISAETDAGARRFYVEEFRRGRLRVLTNYHVLATGFDAPAVRALYITRPVYSRLLYQQMIGRGLRGPLNGGKAWCRIVNVADNVSEYGEELAFRHFEYLWRGQDARTLARGR
jgi:superfamily II DNA or RNA helicase